MRLGRTILGKFILEERLPGNQRRREAMGLPWLTYSASKVEIGGAIAAAEAEVQRSVKLGLWPNRRVPRDVVIIGKFMGDPDEPELPLFVTEERLPAEVPQRHDRLALDERVIVKIATRLIRVERQVSFYRLLTYAALAGLILLAAALGALWLLR
ncbi:MAG: hypothetical protein HY423_00595 [Candidatus Lambdaproteobacteria bacterium]|nr:hypothetical protein [Candidatus Lambdaproteobacteria bacterium]